MTSPLGEAHSARRLERKATAALLAATVAVSFSAIFIRLAGATPATIVWLRMALATLLLAPFAVTGSVRGPRLTRAQVALTLLAGILLGGHFLLWTASLGLTSVAASVLLVSVHPLLVAPAARRMLGEGGLRAPSGRTLLACLALAVVCTVGGHTVYNWALRHVRALAVSTSFLGEPPLAAILAVAILGNVPPLLTVIGGVLILCGLAISLRSLANDPRSPEPALEQARAALIIEIL